MTNRQKTALETKHKIIASARQLISEKGLDNISVQDITDKAKVAKGSFYTYFKKKEDILSEITYKNFEEIKEKYLGSNQENLIYNYLYEFINAIYNGGLELCKSWTSSEIRGLNCNICKFEFDKNNLAEILEFVGLRNVNVKAYNIISYLYGLMTVWCMTNGKYDLIYNFNNNFAVINKILED